jgi:hypothetical protein
MPTIHRADTNRTADGSAPAVAIDGRIERPGVYLTNEVFLYRVVGIVADAAGKLVELEDCFLLDVVHVPLAEMRARRLRVVTPAG